MKPNEIIGKWELKDGKIIADANCNVIDSMIKNDFTKLDSSEDGWTIRYKDKEGDIWELSYPESHLHGGGPPKLIRIP